MARPSVNYFDPSLLRILLALSIHNLVCNQPTSLTMNIFHRASGISLVYIRFSILQIKLYSLNEKSYISQVLRGLIVIFP